MESLIEGLKQVNFINEAEMHMRATNYVLIEGFQPNYARANKLFVSSGVFQL
jgi:hypothetical protein